MAGWKGAGTRQVSKGKAPQEVSHLQTQSLLLGEWREPLILARHPGTVEQRDRAPSSNMVRSTTPVQRIPLWPHRSPVIRTDSPEP